MAVDKTRENNFMQKKSICLFAAEINEGDQITAASEDFLIANLPPESIILDAFVHVVTASDAAVSAVATLGTTEGGTEIASAIDLASTGDQGTFTGQSVTGTGVPLYLGITYSGAATDVGQYVVVVEYVEYTKNTGEYTVITN